MCLSVPRRIPTLLHGPGCNSWRMVGVPLVVHCWAYLQSVYGFRCYENIARTRNVSECSVLALCLVSYVNDWEHQCPMISYIGIGQLRPSYYDVNSGYLRNDHLCSDFPRSITCHILCWIISRYVLLMSTFRRPARSCRLLYPISNINFSVRRPDVWTKIQFKRCHSGILENFENAWLPAWRHKANSCFYRVLRKRQS